MKNATKYILGFLIILTIFIWVSVAQSPTADTIKNEAQIHILDVGQGDSILIEKGDSQILIDGGPDGKVLSEIGKFMSVSDRTIETVILTHPHADHLAGLNQILDRYEISTIYYSGVNYDSNGYTEFLDKVKSKNINLNIPEIGTEIRPFDNSSLTFLYPGNKFSGTIMKNVNNSSETTKFCYFSSCALFLGDLETDGQADMFSASKDLTVFQSDLLKISHHGSENGTNQLTLTNIAPKLAAISVAAKNKFGHPHYAVLELLSNSNIPFYRTDQAGNITFIINELGLFKR